MKMILVSVLAVTALSSCGLQRQVNELKNRQAQSEVDSAARDAALQAQIDNLQLNLNSVSNQLISIDASIAVQSSSVQAQDVATQAAIVALQAQQASMLTQLALLQGYTSIVSIKDPCGAQGAYNEVMLKLSSGQYLSSFSDNANGKNTRFALLTDGNFITSDGTNCYFTVSNSGTVISNEHN